MKEMRDALQDIIKKVDGELKERVLIDNPTDLDVVEAYNEGVKAMVNQVCYYLNSLCDIEFAKDYVKTLSGGEK